MPILIEQREIPDGPIRNDLSGMPCTDTPPTTKSYVWAIHHDWTMGRWRLFHKQIGDEYTWVLHTGRGTYYAPRLADLPRVLLRPHVSVKGRYR